MFGLTNKNAVVTGAGSGIGKAVALVLAQQGAHVTIVDINEAEAAAVVKEIEGAGGKAAAVAVDVSDQGRVDAAFAGLAALDILVNSAGVSHIGTAESTSEADFDRLYKVNVKGVYNCLHAAIPVMKKQGGVIINVCSIAATVGYRIVCLFDDEGGGLFHDLVCGEGLSEGWDPLQLYFSRAGAYSFCRWVSAKELSGEGTGDVREIIEDAADRPYGEAGGDCRAGAIPG